MSLEFNQLDVFTNETFGGNPLVVVFMQNTVLLDDIKLQQIAAEFNQPMVAFVSNDGHNKDNYKIRYFTTKEEVPLCGHATVGSTFALYAKHMANKSTNCIKQFHFETNFGQKLVATVDDLKKLVTISMPITHSTPVYLNDKWTQNVIKSLGKNFDCQSVADICLSPAFVLIGLKDSPINQLLDLNPDFDAMNVLDRKGARNGIIVTQRADYVATGYHFYSRVFLPWVGVNEDLVCGHAHTQLAPYWIKRLAITRPTQLVGKQCSRRPGIVGCRVNDDRIEISGNAVIVLNGNLIL